jgi:signal peptidase II
VLLIVGIALFGLAAIDQMVKAWVLHQPDPMMILPGFLEIRAVENPGIIFSLVLPLWLIILGSVVSAILLMVALVQAHKAGHERLVVSLCALLAGGMSNLLDRFMRGAVIDYIALPKPLPIINLGDVLVVLGLVMMLIDVWGRRKKVKSD